MEAYTTIIVAVIVALSTLGATFFSNQASAKKFEKELEKARATESRQRRWEVRSKPLLKLREELAVMASELDTLIVTTQEYIRHTSVEDSGGIAAQRIYDKWGKYKNSGDFLKTIHLQYDTDLIKAIDDVQNDYLLLFEYVLDYKSLKPGELKTFREISEKINEKTPLVQELINKKLEDL